MGSGSSASQPLIRRMPAVSSSWIVRGLAVSARNRSLSSTAEAELLQMAAAWTVMVLPPAVRRLGQYAPSICGLSVPFSRGGTAPNRPVMPLSVIHASFS